MILSLYLSSDVIYDILTIIVLSYNIKNKIVSSYMISYLTWNHIWPGSHSTSILFYDSIWYHMIYDMCSSLSCATMWCCKNQSCESESLPVIWYTSMPSYFNLWYHAHYPCYNKKSLSCAIHHWILPIMPQISTMMLALYDIICTHHSICIRLLPVTSLMT